MLCGQTALSTRNNKKLCTKIVKKFLVKTDSYLFGVKRTAVFTEPGKTQAACAVAAFKLHLTASQVAALPPRRPILAAGQQLGLMCPNLRCHAKASEGQSRSNCYLHGIFLPKSKTNCSQ